jgi:hypothetical protein
MTNQLQLLGISSKWIRGWIGIAIGVFFLCLALHQTNVAQVRVILAQSQIHWLLIAISFYFADLTIRVVRWWVLILPIKALSLRAIGTALLIGYAVNNILPARLGEIFRINFAGRRYQMPRSAIAGSIFVERVLDGLIVVLCLILGRLFLPNQGTLNTLTLLGSLIFIGIFLLLGFLSRESYLDNFVRSSAVSNRLLSFRKGLSVMRGDSFLLPASLSLIIWLLEGAAIWSVLKALEISIDWQGMLSVVGVVSLSTLLPSAPGFVGTYQYAYALAVGWFGYEPTLGVAAATATQIFLLGTATLVGLGLYVYLNLVKY